MQPVPTGLPADFDRFEFKFKFKSKFKISRATGLPAGFTDLSTGLTGLLADLTGSTDGP